MNLCMSVLLSGASDREEVVGRATDRPSEGATTMRDDIDTASAVSVLDGGDVVAGSGFCTETASAVSVLDG